jgi:EAL domain-containing protein (putative c-di-GMP-specific phosphodiesterase class I)/ActR/RegA family two-component response regulator
MPERRLVVLDDDADVADTVALVARSHGFDVRTTASPEEFFAWIETWCPSHVAIDLLMPAMDGIEILRALAATSCDARIIVMSGVGAKILESAAHGARERGLNLRGILPKPFRPNELRALLDNEVDGASDAQWLPERTRGGPEEDLRHELDDALRLHQFQLHYQPKVSLSTSRIEGFEALLRWLHPRHGLVPPGWFIPLAERSGRMDALTREVIELALPCLARQHARPWLSLAINVSARNLGDVRFADQLHEQCRRHGVDPSRIILELTESSAAQDHAVALDILTRIRLKGFQLSIDDFGTGYSSMTKLAQLPVSEVKIDRSFVGSMTRSVESRKIVESTIGLARSLALTTVAEGVEDATTLDLLKKLGCDMAQGYHIARPMDAKAAGEWLGEWERVAKRRLAAGSRGSPSTAGTSSTRYPSAIGAATSTMWSSAPAVSSR